MHTSEMARRMSVIACVSLLGVSPPIFAGSVVANINSGGGRSVSAAYGLDASLGNIAGISAGGLVRNVAGQGATQPVSATNLVVTAAPAPVNETGVSQLAGAATLDDGTISVLSGADIGWSVVSGPLVSISAGGVAATAAVYADTLATARGIYLGASNTASFTVLDVNPDNFGLYAGDGLPDGWQVQYFGVNNSNGLASADASGTRQNNRFKYVAGLDPTNSASVFVFRVQAVPGQWNQKQLLFGPRWSDRTYAVLSCSSLFTNMADWTTQTGLLADQGTTRTLTDTNAAGAGKFYRIKIDKP